MVELYPKHGAETLERVAAEETDGSK